MRRYFGAIATTLLVALLAACTTTRTQRVHVVTVTVTPSPPPSRSPESSTPAPSTSSASSPAASASSSAAAAAQTALPGTCDSLLPVTDVNQAAATDLVGRTAFVVGPADPVINRLAYLNCRYGLTTASSPPKVEIGVSLYRSDAAARERISATVDDYVAHGAHADDTMVGGVPGEVLVGGTGSGYDGITVVAAAGQRTVAVTTSRSVTSVSTPAEKVAALALARTGG